MGTAIEPSTSSVIFEHPSFLAFPAIVDADGRLVVIFRSARGNPLDFASRILWTWSDDGGATWAEPEVWEDLPDCDSRNCGGATLSDGVAHFVYDRHSPEGWRRPYVRFTVDGAGWTDPIPLDANDPAGPDAQLTSIANQGLDWDEDHIYFPCFRGLSVLYERNEGIQSHLPTVPRAEPAIAWNRRGELISCCKGGAVDVSTDRGRTWMALGDVVTISQPDLIQLKDGRLLFSCSGKMRLDEWLMLSEDGHDILRNERFYIFDGAAGPALDSRGKAMSIEFGDEILTVLYEYAAPNGPGRVYLVRTPKAALGS